MRPISKRSFLALHCLAAIALLTCGEIAAADGRKTLPTREEIFSPRLANLEQRLFGQIENGRFGKYSLLEAGLIAGGVDRQEELDRYSNRWNALADALQRSGTVCGTSRQRAEAVFTFLHHSLLSGGYSLQASDLRQAFVQGRFNCVTATLLFNCLARRFELKAVGLEAPGHAMSRLVLPDGTLDIETTCPRWFVRGDAGPAAADRRPLRQVSDVELVATIYYNRGVDLLAEKRFADAVAANAKAVRLDPNNATAKGNFLAAINNWAIDLGTTGEYDRAAALLRIGHAADPGYATFRANYVELFRQWSEHLCRIGRSDDALRLLAEAAQEEPNEKFFREAAIEILRRLAR